VIKRVDRGKNHWYIDTDTGQRVPGVTSFTDKGIPKPALINWAGSATAEYAVDHWDELSELSPSVRLKTLQGSRYAAKDAAANKGTKVHDLAQRLVHGDQVTVPDELTGHVESYVRFLDEFDVRPILVEQTIHNAAHNYCGTFDLIADLLDPDDPEPDPEQRRRLTWLLDIKTNRTGIYGETALQVAAYRYAECWIDEDGEEHDMPEVDMAGAVWVRPDGYDLVPLEVDEVQLRYFLYVQQIAEFMEVSRDLVGEPIRSPYESTYRLVREGA
jgi:hypothetical protein